MLSRFDPPRWGRSGPQRNRAAMTPLVTIDTRSPGLGDLCARIVVTLPTFRRPDHLRRTLDSLRAQRPGLPFAVIVMENDAEGRAGLGVAAPVFASGEIAGLALVAHERGNCSAYNAGWETALAEFPAMDYLLVIDDDECAGEGWIERLVETAEALGADIVGGPQRPVFPGDAAGRYGRHPAFASRYTRTGPVPVLFSSGNVLVRRRVLDAMDTPFLDPSFNFTGGGDADFYARCREKGFTFAWCEEAPVFETTPARRMEYSWLRARGLRDGALSSIIERRADGSLAGRLRTLAKSGALLALAPFRSARLALATGSPVIGLYHLHVAVGRFQAEFGSMNEQYRRPEQN